MVLAAGEQGYAALGGRGDAFAEVGGGLQPGLFFEFVSGGGQLVPEKRWWH
jgi:hypothetical protein